MASSSQLLQKNASFRRLHGTYLIKSTRADLGFPLIFIYVHVHFTQSWWSNDHGGKPETLFISLEHQLCSCHRKSPVLILLALPHDSRQGVIVLPLGTDVKSKIHRVNADLYPHALQQCWRTRSSIVLV